ncbi:MAG: YggT family protein [Clostridiaceae bacterium]
MLLSTLFSLIRIIEWIILIDVILSIVSTMGYGINLYHQVEKIAAPIMEPFRRLQNSFGLNIPIDLSPILALVALDLIKTILIWIF